MGTALGIALAAASVRALVATTPVELHGWTASASTDACCCSRSRWRR